MSGSGITSRDTLLQKDRVSAQKQTPLKLSLGQIGLRNIALNQINGLLGTLKRLDAITGEQADKEVIADIRHDLEHGIDLLKHWFGTSPIEE